MKNVHLAAPSRTPIGRFGGRWLPDCRGPWCGGGQGQFGTRRLAAPIRFNSRSGVRATGGRRTKRRAQITYRAGVPETVPAFYGQPGVWFGFAGNHVARQQIMLGRADLVLAGGTESSRAFRILRRSALGNAHGQHGSWSRHVSRRFQ